MKTSITKLLLAGFLAMGLIGANAVFAGDPFDPDISSICKNTAGAVKKGPDAGGKVSVKCVNPKASWKYNGAGKWSCKGDYANCPTGIL